MNYATLLLFFLMAVPFSLAQEPAPPALGDVARATRAHQSQATRKAKMFSNEDSEPQSIKDGEDAIDVLNRARQLFARDTAHRCQQDSSGNSGPGWKKDLTLEVAATDRMRTIIQEGSDRVEWLMVGDQYYLRQSNGSWQKVIGPQQVAVAKMAFSSGVIPQELQFAFQAGELRSLGDQRIGAAPAVLYRYTVHLSDFERTIDFWIGKQDSLPRRIDMRTQSRSRGSAAEVWHESTTCSYGVDIKIEPPF